MEQLVKTFAKAVDLLAIPAIGGYLLASGHWILGSTYGYDTDNLKIYRGGVFDQDNNFIYSQVTRDMLPLATALVNLSAGAGAAVYSLNSGAHPAAAMGIGLAAGAASLASMYNLHALGSTAVYYTKKLYREGVAALEAEEHQAGKQAPPAP